MIFFLPCKLDTPISIFSLAKSTNAIIWNTIVASSIVHILESVPPHTDLYTLDYTCCFSVNQPHSFHSEEALWLRLPNPMSNLMSVCVKCAQSLPMSHIDISTIWVYMVIVSCFHHWPQRSSCHIRSDYIGLLAFPPQMTTHWVAWRNGNLFSTVPDFESIKSMCRSGLRIIFSSFGRWLATSGVLWLADAWFLKSFCVQVPLPS